MPRIVVADAEQRDRALCVRILEKRPFSDIVAVDSGRDALRMLDAGRTDVLIAGADLPDMDAEELFHEARKRHDTLPIVLLTRGALDEAVVKALHLGAASYVPRSRIARSVEDTVARVLALCEKAVFGSRLLDAMIGSSTVFELPGDPALFSDVIHYLLERLDRFDLRGDRDRISIGVAIQEALLNGWIHGNLELSSPDGRAERAEYERHVEERRRAPPYSERKLIVRASFSKHESRIEIEDEGPGFDVASIQDPTLPENITRTSGRGVFLMRQLFDAVEHNDTGNRVTLVMSRRDGEPE